MNPNLSVTVAPSRSAPQLFLGTRSRFRVPSCGARNSRSSCAFGQFQRRLVGRRGPRGISSPNRPRSSRSARIRGPPPRSTGPTRQISFAISSRNSGLYFVYFPDNSHQPFRIEPYLVRSPESGRHATDFLVGPVVHGAERNDVGSFCCRNPASTSDSGTVGRDHIGDAPGIAVNRIRLPKILFSSFFRAFCSVRHVNRNVEGSSPDRAAERTSADPAGLEDRRDGGLHGGAAPPGLAPRQPGLQLGRGGDALWPGSGRNRGTGRRAGSGEWVSTARRVTPSAVTVGVHAGQAGGTGRSSTPT